MKKVFLIGLFFLFLILGSNFVLAQSPPEIIFFWGDGCPHCAKEKLFLEKIEEKYPEIEIKRYEVYKNSENQKLLQEFVQKYDIQRPGVPLTFIGDKYVLGYRDDQTTGNEIEGYIQMALGSEDPNEEVKSITLPIIGEINLSKLSLPVLTIVLAALDGFNPCAMWILLFLVALLINTKSRKRIWLVGGTFILASGIFYFILLAAWFNLFLAIGYVSFTKIIIGIFAIGLGIWQLKEFIYYQPGVCKVLGLKPRLEKKFTEKAEKIVTSPVTFAMIGGLIILAIGVNLVEFFCSAGLPAIFTRILALNSLSTLSYYSYLLLYTFIFMLDDLIIFSLAIITLKKIGFTEKYSRWSTLIGGLLILLLGILLIFKPDFLAF